MRLSDNPISGCVEIHNRDDAKQLLGNKVPNRNLKPSKLAQYQADMLARRFGVNGQGLIISDQGRLMDGQNRLTAFLNTGLPEFEVFVVRGVPESEWTTLDSGAVRTLADVLSARGNKNARTVAGVARIAYSYTAGHILSYQPPKQAVLDFIDEHEWLHEAGRLAAACQDVSRPCPMGAVLALAGDQSGATEHQRAHYRALALSFADGVASGTDLSATDPRHTFREWSIKRRSSAAASGLTPEIVMAATIRAWNAHADGRSFSVIKQLETPTRDSMPIAGFRPEYFPDVLIESLRRQEASRRPRQFPPEPPEARV